MAKQGIDEGGLRVGVKGGGCSGLSYTFAWEKQARLGDEVFEGPDGREDLRRQEEPAVPERHRARLRHEPGQQGVRVQQPERENDLRLRQLLRRVSATLQACRNCGAGAPLDAHFCPQCTKILPLARRRDYFSFLGLPRKLAMNAADLEQRFRSLSRQFHPDYFYNATPAERRASLERSSYLNDAYRTLRKPPARLEYLLKLEGLAPKGPGRSGAAGAAGAARRSVRAERGARRDSRSLREGGAPAEQWKQRLERRGSRSRRSATSTKRSSQELSAQWDAAVDGGAPDAERRAVLEALRERLLERNYISNLLAGIERELNS